MRNATSPRKAEYSSADNESRYLYERQGPWPQPSASHPFSEVPEVMHLPQVELDELQKKIGRRYKWTVLTYWLPALFKALFNSNLDEITNDEFDCLLSRTAISRFQVRIEPGNSHYPQFSSLMKKEGNAYFVSDFSAMETLEPYKKMYVASTQVLMEQKGLSDTGVERKAIAIYLPTSNLLLQPDNQNAWDLAKYFVMEGASYRMVLSTHSLLHFPFDCINAITKSALPMDNTLFRLLLPHFELSLALNHTVLESPYSPIKNKASLPYAALTGREEGFRDLLSVAFTGIPDLPESYPPYHYTLGPDKAWSEYGIFLQSYYEVMLSFTRAVVETLSENEMEEIAIWANYISQWLPEFPDGDKIRDKEILSRTAAKIIWDQSVAHSADHYNFTQIPIRKLPLRLRLAPPSTSEIPPFKRKRLTNFADTFKHLFINNMFFSPHNVSLLCDTDYDFGPNVKLHEAQNRFLQALRDNEAKLKEKGIHIYIPLNEISRSIQY